MIRSTRKLVMWVSLLLSALLASTAWADNSELKFDSSVVAVTPMGEGEGVVTILVKGFEVPIIVNADTEIKDNGDELSLEELAEGDIVVVEAFFSEEFGIVAEEIKIEERAGEHFRHRGELSAIEFSGTPTPTTTGVTTITVLGVEVLVDADTKITRPGSGQGNRVPASELMVGDQVDVRGSFDGVSLWADRIKVGKRSLGKIEIDGDVMEVTAGGFILDIRGGGRATILIDENTDVRGDPVEGASVKVEGMLNEALSVVASEVKVQGNGNGNGNGNGGDEDDDDDDEDGEDEEEDDDE